VVGWLVQPCDGTTVELFATVGVAEWGEVGVAPDEDEEQPEQSTAAASATVDRTVADNRGCGRNMPRSESHWRPPVEPAACYASQMSPAGGFR